MSQLIFIRTDASQQIGSGHVMRCVALAEALRDFGGSIEFITRPHLGNMNAYIKSRGFKVHSLPNSKESKLQQNLSGYESWLGVKQVEDAEDTIKLLAEVQPDWLIIDHYALDNDWESRIRPHTKKSNMED